MKNSTLFRLPDVSIQELNIVRIALIEHYERYPKDHRRQCEVQAVLEKINIHLQTVRFSDTETPTKSSLDWQL